MTRAAHPASGPRGHALWMRVATAVVLVGYGMTLGATSAGHGFRLMAHIVGEHHERLEALAFGDSLDEARYSNPLSGRAQDEARQAGGAAHSDCPPLRGTARALRSGVSMRGCAPAASDAMGGVAEGSEHGEAHGHGEARGHGEAEHLASGFHSHHGHVHSHHEEPPPAALVTITLDKHCLASRPAVPAPRELRTVEPAAPFEALTVVVHPVEVRPPERSA